jgi:transposase
LITSRYFEGFGAPTVARRRGIAVTVTERGNTSLRELFIQGAQSSFRYLKRDQSSLGEWLRQVEARRHRQVAVVALANKMVRICWKVLTSEQVYEPYPARVA